MCLFANVADGFNEPHGKTRVPFPVKMRKRGKDNSVSNDEIQNRAMTTELYEWILGKHISSGDFAKLQKTTISDVISVCLPIRPSVRPYVSMEQLGSH